MAEGRTVQDEIVLSEQRSKQPNDHPVYREISVSNGVINKMKKEEVKGMLMERGLDARCVFDNIKLAWTFICQWFKYFITITRLFPSLTTAIFYSSLLIVLLKYY